MKHYEYMINMVAEHEVEIDPMKIKKAIQDLVLIPMGLDIIQAEVLMEEIKESPPPSTDGCPGDQDGKTVPMSRKRRNGNKITGA